MYPEPQSLVSFFFFKFVNGPGLSGVWLKVICCGFTGLDVVLEDAGGPFAFALICQSRAMEATLSLSEPST